MAEGPKAKARELLQEYIRCDGAIRPVQDLLEMFIEQMPDDPPEPAGLTTKQIEQAIERGNADMPDSEALKLALVALQHAHLPTPDGRRALILAVRERDRLRGELDRVKGLGLDEVDRSESLLRENERLRKRLSRYENVEVGEEAVADAVIADSPPSDGREWDCQCAHCGSSVRRPLRYL